ncbi:MAG TPA: class I SAM-dependent methyltransferase [Pseudonocardiaceae bacterium]|nr:class I SAM-dependent methyltransferase [Pseudonocardiaceae bacterium]
MPDAIFADPRLAPIYDAFDGDRDDLTAYLGIAEELRADRVLDVGCGTGCLAILLADSGRAVVGVDPAAASLQVAKSKDRAGRVTWVHGDATTMAAHDADLADLADPADLVVMSGNVAQVFLTDDDWARVLHGIRAVLRPGGHLVFETRRPEYRAWEDWAADAARVTLDIPGIGSVEQCREVTDLCLPLVSFRYTYRFLTDDTVITSDSTLRFRGRPEIEASLAAAGYQVRDVREAPDRPGREFVFIAERSAADLGPAR